MKAGDPAAAEKRFAACLPEKEAAGAIVERAAERKRNAAKAARNLASLTLTANVAKAAEYYKRAPTSIPLTRRPGSTTPMQPRTPGARAKPRPLTSRRP